MGAPKKGPHAQVLFASIIAFNTFGIPLALLIRLLRVPLFSLLFLLRSDPPFLACVLLDLDSIPPPSQRLAPSTSLHPLCEPGSSALFIYIIALCLLRCFFAFNHQQACLFLQIWIAL